AGRFPPPRVDAMRFRPSGVRAGRSGPRCRLAVRPSRNNPSQSGAAVNRIGRPWRRGGAGGDAGPSQDARRTLLLVIPGPAATRGGVKMTQVQEQGARTTPASAAGSSDAKPVVQPPVRGTSDRTDLYLFDELLTDRQREVRQRMRSFM